MFIIDSHIALLFILQMAFLDLPTKSIIHFFKMNSYVCYCLNKRPSLFVTGNHNVTLKIIVKYCGSLMFDYTLASMLT